MNPINQSDLIIGHQTHAGETGKNNEDRALIRFYRGLHGEAGEVTLAVVADGIGGHRAGEVASQIAIDTFDKLFSETDSRSYLDLFTRAFATIQQVITNHVASHTESEGMGTTCSAVIIANRRLYTAFVGDSRIYLIREGSIRQISVDHTWVQEAIEHGILTKQEARKHPNRHVVRRHLGAGSDATPDFRIQLEDSQKPEDARRNQGMPLKPGDILLLSSDGMTDLVEDHEILAAFEENRAPQQAIEALVLLARQRGGFDNITVTAIMVPMSAAPSAAAQPGRSLTPALLGSILLAILLALVLIALVVGGYFLFFSNTLSTPTPTATIAVPTITPTVRATVTPTPQPATLQPDTPTALPPTATLTPIPTLPPSSTPPISLTSAWLTLTAEMQAQGETLTALAPTP